MKAPAALIIVAALVGPGCSLLGGGSIPPRTYYVLDDGADGAMGGNAAVARHAIPRTLLITVGHANPLADSRALVYAPAPIRRAQYQFASWAERPSERIVHLLQQRLNQRETFAATALLGSGVTGELLLSVVLEELFHDVTTKPGQARMALEAELIDRRTGTLLGRRSFAVFSRVAAENAEGAVRAMSASLGTILDEMVPWIEAVARGDRNAAHAARARD